MQLVKLLRQTKTDNTTPINAHITSHVYMMHTFFAYNIIIIMFCFVFSSHSFPIQLVYYTVHASLASQLSRQQTCNWVCKLVSFNLLCVRTCIDCDVTPYTRNVDDLYLLQVRKSIPWLKNNRWITIHTVDVIAPFLWLHLAIDIIVRLMLWTILIYLKQ